MKTIYKYPLAPSFNQILFLPKDYQILKVETQNNIGCIWAIVDTSLESEEVFVNTIGTGHEVPENIGDYIGAYQITHGQGLPIFVAHVFISKTQCDLIQGCEYFF